MVQHHLSLTQLTLLVAGAVAMGALLVFLVYFIHKIFKERREGGDEVRSAPPRPQDDATFAVATLQGVITRMKEQEKELVELRRAAERRARESARISENVLRDMPNGLLVFNREGFLTSANPAVRKLLGLDTWSRRRYPEILGRDSLLTHHLRMCLETGKTVAQETLRYETPAGPVRVLGVSLSPFHGPAGEIEGAICLLTDLTEVQQLQEQVRVKEQLAALGAMSAGIAHELKNSLATISGYAQLLRDSDLSEENRDFAEKVVREIRNLTRVVTDFLTISKPLHLTARQVSVEGLLREAVEDLQRAEAFAGVSFSFKGDFVPVEGDEVLLRQALSNLLRNSCEALAGQAASGQVALRGSVVRQSEREFLEIRITDTGVGVPAEDREKVFLPFFTTKPEGSGLGLALVQKIIVGHNGSINLESSSPEGASFVILLPLRQQTAAGTATGESLAQPAPPPAADS